MTETAFYCSAVTKATPRGASLYFILDYKAHHLLILWAVFTGSKARSVLRELLKKMHERAAVLDCTSENAYLLLEDGSVFPGRHFGAEKPVDGEIGKCTSNTCLSIVLQIDARAQFFSIIVLTISFFSVVFFILIKPLTVVTFYYYMITFLCFVGRDYTRYKYEWLKSHVGLLLCNC